MCVCVCVYIHVLVHVFVYVHVLVCVHGPACVYSFITLHCMYMLQNAELCMYFSGMMNYTCTCTCHTCKTKPTDHQGDCCTWLQNLQISLDSPTGKGHCIYMYMYMYIVYTLYKHMYIYMYTVHVHVCTLY